MAIPPAGAAAAGAPRLLLRRWSLRRCLLLTSRPRRVAAPSRPLRSRCWQRHTTFTLAPSSATRSQPRRPRGGQAAPAWIPGKGPALHALRRPHGLHARAALLNKHACKRAQPAPTTTAPSCVGFILGDLLAQHLGHHGGSGGAALDLARVARLGAYGLCIDGPLGALWYDLLVSTPPAHHTRLGTSTRRARPRVRCPAAARRVDRLSATNEALRSWPGLPGAQSLSRAL